MKASEYLNWLANNADDDGKSYVDRRDIINAKSDATSAELAALEAVDRDLGNTIIKMLDVRDHVAPWK